MLLKLKKEKKYIIREIFLFENHAKNEAGRLVLFLFLKKALYCIS